ncbi:hypothetical protein GCM10012275_11350 [Longimycelium tulufanense]|uniref:Uncharacterized protein n=1 Tax=Longimycelium tulufanense TaxID=907463 RepID=A0A8J3CB74_9PSEU|nr:hypothetical protein GCM10012275_11350 [Longimycelium tulufanense]
MSGGRWELAHRSPVALVVRWWGPLAWVGRRELVYRSVVVSLAGPRCGGALVWPVPTDCRELTRGSPIVSLAGARWDVRVVRRADARVGGPGAVVRPGVVAARSLVVAASYLNPPQSSAAVTGPGTVTDDQPASRPARGKQPLPHI